MAFLYYRYKLLFNKWLLNTFPLICFCFCSLISHSSNSKNFLPENIQSGLWGSSLSHICSNSVTKMVYACSRPCILVYANQMCLLEQLVLWTNSECRTWDWFNLAPVAKWWSFFQLPASDLLFTISFVLYINMYSSISGALILFH